ncbi:MAG: carboxypeptidase-like regulatory domain-containing protein [Bacteroidota bacterium]
MDTKKRLWFSMLAWVLFLLIPASSFTQQMVGKISGYVHDKKTNEALPGANVIIKGTTIGAAADIEGYFFILNVPPGRYTVEASMMGYVRTSVENVLVTVNQTTEVNFDLNEAVLEIGEEVVVFAERPLVKPDMTAKVSTMTAKDIREMPVTELVDLLATQSNMSILTNTPYEKRGYEVRGIDDIRMRGGRNNEVGLLIDGMKVSNPLFGGFGTRLGNNAINQISVLAGGFSAEYGNALSGFVNLSTSEGGQNYSGEVEYLSSVPFGINALALGQGKELGLQRMEASLGGPVPLVKNMTFFMSTESEVRASTVYDFDDVIWDDHRDLDGDGIPDVPTSLELMRDYWEDGSVDWFDNPEKNPKGYSWRDVRTDREIGGRSNRSINPLDNFKGWKGLGWNNNIDAFLKLTYRFTPTMKLSISELKQERYRQSNRRSAIYYYRLPTRTVNIDEQRGEELNRSGMATREVNHTASNRIAVDWNHALSPSTFYTFKFQRFHQQRRTRILEDYDDPYGSFKFLGIKIGNRWAPDWGNIKAKEDYDFRNTFGIRDPWEGYFRMRGDGVYFEGDSSATYDFRIDVTSQVHRHHQLKFGAQFIYIDLSRVDYQSSSALQATPTIYQTSPKEGAFYFTDKIEYSNIVVNVGGRLDWANSGGRMWADPLDPLGEQDPDTPGFDYNGFIEGKNKLKISPRIGIAYPLTDKSVVHFNFGHFYQNPNYRDLFRRLGDETRETAMIRGGAIIGNPSLENEKAIQYEIGLQQQIGNNFGLNINMWTKETLNQVGSVLVPAYSDPGQDSPFSYSVFLNNNFGSAKGVDVTLTKRYSGYFSGTVNYTYSRSRVLTQTSWDGYWNDNTKLSLPKQETRPEWDKPHVIRVNINFSMPKGKGPSLWGRHPLSDFGINLIYYGESGYPYTPTVAEGQFREQYSERWPFYHQFDLRSYKNFTLFGWRYSVIVEVINLFDRKNVIEGYTATGSATVPGPGTGSSYSATRMNGININNYGPRRRVSFGLRLRF